MPRPASFDVRCINIRVHTKHAADEYANLWRALHRLRQPLVKRSGSAVMLGEVRRLEGDERQYLRGEFYRFIQINEEDQWFNIQEHKPAEADELQTISIPPDLRPNLQFVPYVFDLTKHRLFVVTRAAGTSLSIETVFKLLESLISHPKIVERFGEVDLTVSTEVTAVDKLFSLAVIRKIEIVLERPNPNDYEDEQAVFNEFERMGAKREVREYTKADSAQTLVPDEGIRRVAAIAADNGSAVTRGLDHLGKPAIRSSRQYPWQGRSTYNSNTQTLLDALRGYIDTITGRLP